MMRNIPKHQYLLVFGMTCILAAVLVYAIPHLACEDDLSPYEVIARTQANMYGLSSYRSETISTEFNGETTITSTSIQEYVAPDRYYWKNDKGDNWLEYLAIGDEEYYRTPYGMEWQTSNIFYREDGSYFQVMVFITDQFTILNGATKVSELPNEVIDNADCLRYQWKLQSTSDSTESLIDIWVGEEEHLLHQMKITTLDSGSGPVNITETNQTVTMINWYDFNENFKIEAPAITANGNVSAL